MLIGLPVYDNDKDVNLLNDVTHAMHRKCIAKACGVTEISTGNGIFLLKGSGTLLTSLVFEVSFRNV